MSQWQIVFFPSFQSPDVGLVYSEGRSLNDRATVSLWQTSPEIVNNPKKNPNVISIKITLNNIFTKNFGWNTSVHPQEARQIEKTKTKHLDDQVLLTQSLLSNNIFLYHFTEFAYNQDISYVIQKQKTNQKENFYKIIKKKIR